MGSKHKKLCQGMVGCFGARYFVPRRAPGGAGYGRLRQVTAGYGGLRLRPTERERGESGRIWRKS